MEPQRDYRGELQTIRGQLQVGQITYAEARKVAQPILDEMNAKLKKMCEEDGTKFKPFTFHYVMR